MTMMNLEHPEHPIVRIEGSLIYFDTGSPQSLIPDPNAAWLNTLGITAPPMSGLAGPAFGRARSTLARLTGGLMIDALIGMDLITEQGLSYDLLNRQLGWGIPQNTLDSMIALRSELVMGLPVVHLELAGQPRRAILDTGCHFDGYFIDLPKNLPDAGVIQDENPIIGTIESAARYAEAALLAKNGTKINLGQGRFGEALPALEFALTSIGVDGVVGAVVFWRTGSVVFKNNLCSCAGGK
jgi:hypothetical protein